MLQDCGTTLAAAAFSRAAAKTHRCEDLRKQTAEQRSDDFAVTKVRAEVVDGPFDVRVLQLEVDPADQEDVDRHLLIGSIQRSWEHQRTVCLRLGSEAKCKACGITASGASSMKFLASFISPDSFLHHCKLEPITVYCSIRMTQRACSSTYHNLSQSTLRNSPFPRSSQIRSTFEFLLNVSRSSWNLPKGRRLAEKRALLHRTKLARAET